jgi:predicted esterase
VTDAAGTRIVGNPHAGQPRLHEGPAVAAARIVAILVHGRGGSAEGIMALGRALDLDDVAFLAPAAASHTWYPQSFLTPTDQNEPGLSSGLGVLASLVDELSVHGVGPDRVAIVGFSQGGCLALEFSARHAQRYAAVIGLSAGLIGPPGTPRAYAGSFGGTPVLLGCSDVDAHIPLERVHETGDVFRTLGADVDLRIYPGAPHAVMDDEIEAARALLGAA